MGERAYFVGCRALGSVLRSARYSRTRVVHQDHGPQVHKARSRYAPLLISMGGLLLKILGTGVRVLGRRDWEERERDVQRKLRGTSIRIDAGGTLVMPCLPGQTLAALLEDPELPEPIRKQAIEQAVVALAEFHRLGFTHADAMAENVLIDLAPQRHSGNPEHSTRGEAAAHWFDFETVHDSSRPMAWGRADDVRALAVTCLLRTAPEQVAATLQLILDVYDDEDVTRLLAASFTSVLRRPLAFHLAQAGLSYQRFQEIARLLRERTGA